MSIENTGQNIEEEINRINIYMITKNIIGEVSKKTRLPSKFLFLGNLPKSRETFMVEVKLEYNKKGISPEFDIVDYNYVLDGVENSELLNELNETNKTPILIDDTLANELFGDNRDPEAVKAMYKLPDGKDISVFMPTMKRVIH